MHVRRRCVIAAAETFERGRVAAYSLTGGRRIVRTVFWTRNTFSRFWFSSRWTERIKLLRVDFPVKHSSLPRIRPRRFKLDDPTLAEKSTKTLAGPDRFVRSNANRENILPSSHYRETLRSRKKTENVKNTRDDVFEANNSGTGDPFRRKQIGAPVGRATKRILQKQWSGRRRRRRRVKSRAQRTPIREKWKTRKMSVEKKC